MNDEAAIQPADDGRLEAPVRPLCAAERAELASLRKRVKAQRAELRRLNKIDSLLWAGWRWGCDTSRRNINRAKMIRAFGLEEDR